MSSICRHPRTRFEDGGKQENAAARKTRPLSLRGEEHRDPADEQDNGEEVETPRPRSRMLRGKEDERAGASADRSRQEKNAGESACGRGGERGERLAAGGLVEAERNDESPGRCDKKENRENEENPSDRKVSLEEGSLTHAAQGEREKSEPDTSWAKVQGTGKKALAAALRWTCFHLRSEF